MHGLVNRAIQCFVRDSYGEEIWETIAMSVDLESINFEAMLTYEDKLTGDVLDGVATQLAKSKEIVLEDIGTYLVAHSKTEALRRLLRFGGNTFIEFLHSLEDLQSRIHLAVPALEFPALEVEDVNNQNFLISVIGPNPEFAPVLAGVLRALADDYGALVLIEPGNRVDGGMQLMISVTEAQFTVGRQFELAGAQV